MQQFLIWTCRPAKLENFLDFDWLAWLGSYILLASYMKSLIFIGYLTVRRLMLIPSIRATKLKSIKPNNIHGLLITCVWALGTSAGFGADGVTRDLIGSANVSNHGYKAIIIKS